MVELIRIGITVVLTTQASYFAAMILVYESMMDWYEWSTFPDPENIFEKTVNVVTASFIGVAYWAGLRVKKRNWFMKRVYLVGYLSVYTIFATIVYNILYSFVKFLGRTFGWS
ncbi:hypothetical protein A374_04724 [Fictibacillus macauensis ZFHKF-1]|uniref:Uncharacterized protein n=1 Tax=Fictibacillus macauensis ZFHKF-1 TaxID=1196324 RepID=I8AME6_9BACL|nr:hypothetical protein [Fictibacillus macauensis]EIT86849.1 hypothetical protein A374_04724 [Fictibacillus macauensis ZFHKF-1]